MSIKVTNEQPQRVGIKNDAPSVVIETVIDKTLSIEGAAADAKTVGDKFIKIEKQINNGGSNLQIDSELSTESTNPVENKVIAEAIGDINTALETILGV